MDPQFTTYCGIDGSICSSNTVRVVTLSHCEQHAPMLSSFPPLLKVSCTTSDSLPRSLVISMPTSWDATKMWGCRVLGPPVRCRVRETGKNVVSGTTTDMLAPPFQGTTQRCHQRKFCGTPAGWKRLSGMQITMLTTKQFFELTDIFKQIFLNENYCYLS